MQSQPLTSKLGEIKYRAKIVNQQLGTENTQLNEYNSTEFKLLFGQKLKLTEKTFRSLQKKGYTLSPFLEIGAEHSIRTSLLVSKFKAQGFSTDISLHSLTKSKQFAKMFNLNKTAKIICCDANNLPFKSNSIPFIFFYETLHHFPDPKVPLKEAYRVLAPGGICLVGSDPIKQKFQIKFWRRPNKLRIWEKALKYALILPFISHIGKTEVEEGILEEAFSLNTWQKAFDIFDDVEVNIKAFPYGPTQSIKKSEKRKWFTPNLKTNIVLSILGGGLSAICKKKGQYKITKKNLQDLLICPDCLTNNKENKISKSANSFKCRTNNHQYEIYKNVPIMVEARLKSHILKA